MRITALGIALISFVLLAGPAGAEPPPGRQWVKTFGDEFDGGRLDGSKWQALTTTDERLLSARVPENAVVENGLLRLVTRHQSRLGKEWTTGFVRSQPFTQAYGYFEARIRIASGPGLNNAFWLFVPPKGGQEQFEIDILEGHFPDGLNMTVHYGRPVKPYMTRDKVPEDLSRDFHIYGVEWLAKPGGGASLVWYFDGQVRKREECPSCTVPSPVLLSTAVFPWAGEASPQLNGTSMDIDWVRVYRPAE